MDIEKVKNKKEEAEMQIANILNNLEIEVGLKVNMVYLSREKVESELMVHSIERINAEITLIL